MTRSGFTLMEILIAIAILGVLAAAVGPAIFNYLAGARVDTAKMELRTIKSAIDKYELDMGELPNRLKDLTTRPTDPEKRRKWMRGAPPKKGLGYLVKEVKRDPWGTPYVYRPTEKYKGYEYTLFSYGPDKKRAKPVDRIHVWDLD